MTYLACLPMYDLPEIRGATDTLWAAIAVLLADAPAALTRGGDLLALWTDPALLLGQSCGYPLVTSLAGRVRLVATPRYTAPGCHGACYRSALVVRRGDAARSLGDLRGRRCAVNSADSNSGMALLRAAVAPLADASGKFFGATVLTGAHEASLATVLRGDADVAAIDCVTWALLRRVRRAATHGLRVLDWTAAAPGLPLITARAEHVAMLRTALADVAADPALAATRATLLLDGFSILPLAAYNIIDPTPLSQL